MGRVGGSIKNAPLNTSRGESIPLCYLQGIHYVKITYFTCIIISFHLPSDTGEVGMDHHLFLFCA